MSPRLINKEMLCEYVCMSWPTVQKSIKHGTLPSATRIDCCRNLLWDIKLVDQYLDELSGFSQYKNVDDEISKAILNA